MEVLVFRQGDAGLGDGELAVVEVPELDPRGVVGPFDAAVELGTSGWRDEQWNVEILTGSSSVCLAPLRTAVSRRSCPPPHRIRFIHPRVRLELSFCGADS